MNKQMEPKDALEKLKNIKQVASIFINEVIKELVETFEPLVDRATPMKPKLSEFTEHDFYNCAYVCGKCGNAVTDDCDTEIVPSYCEHCGQALDWSENE